ncbi:homeobox protein 2-like [Tigriopus californicus]|uniref:homeobox protein 2-like n=1 Tax=Tigriopus californicus TaxID=6832 RepID=UPI0027DA9870|nr:homeobox protein 2-like [Tigriopus californicus]|eukprot:TCALIF_11742-PA protein Name:"Protein of unknown function" AED:0.01 eAED:0.01 QI:0/0.66/0.5/0.75/0.33/0.5/4/0/208
MVNCPTALILLGSAFQILAEKQDQRFIGGIINDIFSGDSRCQSCEYDSGKANYCCKYNLERRCCSYIAVGGSGGYAGNPSYNYPGYGNNINNNNFNSGSGSYYQKTGQCPPISYFGSSNNNVYGRRKREAPPQSSQLGGRRYTGGYYGNLPGSNNYFNNNNNNGFGNDFGYSNGNNYNCYYDNECPGSKKCCSQYDGSRACAYPSYYG